MLAGNFMADSVKGSAGEAYSEGVRRGIRLHRAIDSYTDGHDTVAQSKRRLREKFKKYAPVVADVFYDHFLAKGWQAFSAEPLRGYVDRVYAELEPFYDVFPQRTQRFYDYMREYDVLYGYASLEGIDRVMRGMARRTSFASGMEHAAAELEANYLSYQAEFSAFFPDLQRHIRTFEE